LGCRHLVWVLIADIYWHWLTLYRFSSPSQEIQVNSNPTRRATNQIITGGISPAQNSLFFAADFSSNSQSITLTVNLSLVANNVSFLVMDVDHPVPDGADKIVVTGSDVLGAIVLPTLTATNPTCVDVVGNVATGLCIVDNTLDNGNVSVSFNSGIDKIIIEFREGSSLSDPGGHGVAISDISFDPPPA
jgi:hypothetical protein